jgi:putative ABC transport system permease protein
MRAFRQILAVTTVNLTGLPQRLWPSLVIVVGMACVVGVLLSMLSFSAGLARSIESAAAPDRAIVIRTGARDEAGQAITREAAVAVLNAPGIQLDADRQPIASAENTNPVPATRRDGQLPVRMILRGVGPKAFALRPEFKLVSGRMFRPGTHELVVGTAAQAQFESLGIGDKVIMPDGEWEIVGSFETGGDQIEGQLLGDADTVMASRRSNGFGSVIVRLESPDAFERFASALLANPALDVDVRRQTDFYAQTAGQFTTFFTTVAYLLGGIIGIGALFGTINIMHSAVASRTREIATLRAVGYGAAPVAMSVLAEALLLSIAGAFIGAAVAWLIFNGNRNSFGGFVVFDLAITPRLFAIGMGWAVGIALLGGLFPAIRAARLPVATALRATS